MSAAKATAPDDDEDYGTGKAYMEDACTRLEAVPHRATTLVATVREDVFDPKPPKATRRRAAPRTLAPGPIRGNPARAIRYGVSR